MTTGSSSWQEGVENEHEVLADFLENVAESETIQAAIARSIVAMHLRPDSRVLDVGCGTGVLFPPLAAALGSGGRMVGLDHGESFLRDARARAVREGFADRLELVRADAHRLPFPDDTFDAAHTERVLMHLIDPDTAIAEMRRVVKPGGWIVSVEPDLLGMRIDDPDHDRAVKVLAGFWASIQNPSIGLELNRRFTAAGLIDRRIEVLTEVERDFPEDVEEFMRRAAATSVERGLLTSAEAAAAVDAMAASAQAGHYTSYSTMFIVSARVPD